MVPFSVASIDKLLTVAFRDNKREQIKFLIDLVHKEKANFIVFSQESQKAEW